MNTNLIAGVSVPNFDKDIVTWLKRTHPRMDDEPIIVKIGIRNLDRRIYRHITLCGKRQHFDMIAFLDQSGFSALPVGFAKETGFDYVFQHDDW